MCEGAITIVLVSSSTYLGVFLGSLIVSFFADNSGRRSSILAAWTFVLVGAILVAFTVNIYMTAVGLLFCGIGSGGMNICFFFFNEVVGEEKRQKYSVIIQIFWCLGALLVTGFFYFIELWRINWIILITVPTVINWILMFTQV